MIPTAHGAIFACRFAQGADLCVVCLDVGTK
jgi:hypothetical protein